MTYMELTNTPATFQPGDKVRILATGAIAHVIDTVPSPAPRFLVYIAPCSVWKDATEIEVAA